MSYLYEEGAEGEWVTGFYPPDGGMLCIDRVYKSPEEAAERVNYLNGGLDPEFKAAMLEVALRFVDAYSRANFGDGLAGVHHPEASDPRCIHGRRRSEDCELCADYGGQETTLIEPMNDQRICCVVHVGATHGTDGICHLPAGHAGEHRFE